jgi:hypothetical protein
MERQQVPQYPPFSIITAVGTLTIFSVLPEAFTWVKLTVLEHQASQMTTGIMKGLELSLM